MASYLKLFQKRRGKASKYSTDHLFVANLTIDQWSDECCLDIFRLSTSAEPNSPKTTNSKYDLFLRLSGLKPYDVSKSKNILFSPANGGFRSVFSSTDLTLLTALVVQAEESVQYKLLLKALREHVHSLKCLTLTNFLGDIVTDAIFPSSLKRLYLVAPCKFFPCFLKSSSFIFDAKDNFKFEFAILDSKRTLVKIVFSALAKVKSLHEIEASKCFRNTEFVRELHKGGLMEIVIAYPREKARFLFS